MNTIHNYECTVKYAGKNFIFNGEVFDEPFAKAAELGEFFTKVTIHECSDKGAKKIGEFAYPSMSEEELKDGITNLVKNIDKTLKCL